MIPLFSGACDSCRLRLHRYFLVYSFVKNRKNAPSPPQELAIWPRVTIQLPIYNEALRDRAAGGRDFAF